MHKPTSAQIIFLAMGYPYVVMAINAARSVRASGTVGSTKLVTNLPIKQILFQGQPAFDFIEVVDSDTNMNRWVKTQIIHRADGEANAFLDCDVEVLAPLNPVLSILDNFDVAARNLPFETGAKFDVGAGLPIKDLSLSEINTGVIFFKKSAGAVELFDRWHANFKDGGHPRDQPAFLRALLESGSTRFFALPPMWNATPFKIVDLAQMRRQPDKIRILHYRDPTFWPEVSKRIAAAHEGAEFELRHPSSSFEEQRAAYGEVARRYKSVLFQSAAGRAAIYLSRRIGMDSKKARIRVYGEKKTPAPTPGSD